MPSIKQVLPTKKQICRGDQWSPAVVRKRASLVQKGRRRPPMNLPAAKFTLSAKRLRDCFERKTNLLQSLRHGKPCHLPLHKGGFLFVRFVHFADSGFKIILCQQAEGVNHGLLPQICLVLGKIIYRSISQEALQTLCRGEPWSCFITAVRCR